MQEIKFCPKCGQPYNENDIYCQHCGYMLKQSQPTVDENAFTPSFSVDNHESETPLYEKTTPSMLNYSQILRRNLYVNPAPLFIGLFVLLFSIAELIFIHFQESDSNVIYYVMSGFTAALAIFYLFSYLIINPLRMISQTKKASVNNYRLSFYQNHLHYLFEASYYGQPIKNEIKIRYDELVKFHHFKDMTLCIFITRGMRVPLCFIKDEHYDSIIDFLRPRMEELSQKK